MTEASKDTQVVVCASILIVPTKISLHFPIEPNQHAGLTWFNSEEIRGDRSSPKGLVDEPRAISGDQPGAAGRGSERGQVLRGSLHFCKLI